MEGENNCPCSQVGVFSTPLAPSPPQPITPQVGRPRMIRKDSGGDLKVSSNKEAGLGMARRRLSVGHVPLSLLRKKMDGYEYSPSLPPATPATNQCLPGPLPLLLPLVIANPVDVNSLNDSASISLPLSSLLPPQVRPSSSLSVMASHWSPASNPSPAPLLRTILRTNLAMSLLA